MRFALAITVAAAALAGSAAHARPPQEDRYGPPHDYAADYAFQPARARAARVAVLAPPTVAQPPLLPAPVFAPPPAPEDVYETAEPDVQPAAEAAPLPPAIVRTPAPAPAKAAAPMPPAAPRVVAVPPPAPRPVAPKAAPAKPAAVATLTAPVVAKPVPAPVLAKPAPAAVKPAPAPPPAPKAAKSAPGKPAKPSTVTAKAATPAKPLAATPAAQPAARQLKPVERGQRFYSVQREYGVQPDPVLPRQFFDESAAGDMAEPPPPVERRSHPITVNGQTTNRPIDTTSGNTADAQSSDPAGPPGE